MGRLVRMNGIVISASTVSAKPVRIQIITLMIAQMLSAILSHSLFSVVMLIFRTRQFVYRYFITVHGLVGLLSDLCCSQLFSFTRTASQVIQEFAKDEVVQVMRSLRRLRLGIQRLQERNAQDLDV